MSRLHPVVAEVTAAIVERSRELRQDYLQRMAAARPDGAARGRLSCANLAHVMAAAGEDKSPLQALAVPNIGIVSAYNDMLSAHQPLENYPAILRMAARKFRASAQMAGGVPAMCDGVTQGQPGMELSLFSRDVIAMATAVALTHDAFDAALLLGVCDKIVPGLFIGAASFGHLPTLFVPAGPMPSGLPNKEKAAIRQRYAEGRATRSELLAAEAASYHSAGTCTFYGTANSNQLLMEAMGLHVPGAAFVPPGSPLRLALTEAAVQRVLESSAIRDGYRPFAEIIDERSIVNAVVALMASGGSTNHTLHLIAMARAVGLLLNWDDMARLSAVTPLLARIYPNGSADVNHFHAAGGVAFLLRELLQGGLLHADARTVWADDLHSQAREPLLIDGQLQWCDAPAESADESVLRPLQRPFSASGGLKLLRGNLGEGVIKVSAVDPDHWHIRAPARVFDSQEALGRAFREGQLEGDLVAVVRFQGPAVNGMPELHGLTPVLASLQDRGQRVALVTDGRMSGASGKVPAAIHVSPAADGGGALARVRDGDLIELDAEHGRLQLEVSAEELASRPLAVHDDSVASHGLGRELFAAFRRQVGPASAGASVLY